MLEASPPYAAPERTTKSELLNAKASREQRYLGRMTARRVKPFRGRIDTQVNRCVPFGLRCSHRRDLPALPWRPGVDGRFLP